MNNLFTILIVIVAMGCNRSATIPAPPADVIVHVPEQPAPVIEVVVEVPADNQEDPCDEQESLMVDDDYDGFGNADVVVSRSICDDLEIGLVPVAWNRIDCDDNNADINPNADEVCDGVLDNNCDGVDDPNEVDDDGDGYTVCNPEPDPTAVHVDFTSSYSEPDPWFMLFGADTSLGGFTFSATSEVVIDTVRVELYVSDFESDFNVFDFGAQNAVNFADHFHNCRMIDSVTQAIIAGPIDPDPNLPWLIFTDSFSIDPTVNGELRVNVQCEHTGLAPTGRYDAFGVDMLFEQDVTAFDLNTNEAASIEIGNVNGESFPSVYRVLEDPACQITERRLYDLDGDGYGDPNNYIEVSVCDPFLAGFVAWITGNEDCDDANADVYPFAPEWCDAVDHDCDGIVDPQEADVIGAHIWYFDADGDGHGAYLPATTSYNCDWQNPPGPGYVPNADDCNDTHASSYPGADEVCDGLDNDCDGMFDEDPVDPVTIWYGDRDNDGWGYDFDEPFLSCSSFPPGSFFSEVQGDCNDFDPSINPNGIEILDLRDNDCNGITDDVPPPGPTDPCDDPAVIVTSDTNQNSNTTKGGEATIASLIVSAGNESVYSQDASFVIVSDDDTTTPSFDQIPNPQDHILYCDLYDGTGYFLTGPEPVAANGTVMFEDVDLFIFRYTSEEMDLVCNFSNVSVVNGNLDRYSSYINVEGDLTFYEEDLDDAPACYPFGLPSQDINRSASVYEHAAIPIAFNGPLPGNLTAGQNDATVFDAHVSSIHESTDWHGLEIELVGDFTIVDAVHVSYVSGFGNWVTVSRPVFGSTVPFTGIADMVFDQGFSSPLLVSLDISPLALPGESVYAQLVTSSIDAIGMDSGDTIPASSIIPGAPIAGHTFTVQ